MRDFVKVKLTKNMCCYFIILFSVIAFLLLSLSLNADNATVEQNSCKSELTVENQNEIQNDIQGKPFHDPFFDNEAGFDGRKENEKKSNDSFDDYKRINYFSKDIIYDVNYYTYDNYIPFGFYSPTTKSEEKLPLIVWLHSDAENNCNLKYFFNHGLTRVLNEWPFDEKVNAYFLFPHLIDEYDFKRWNNEHSEKCLRELLDFIMEKYDVDENNVFVCGHSMGGQGALYMAAKMPDYFKKAVVCSGYNAFRETTNVKIPIRAYVGVEKAGEDYASVKFTMNTFSYLYGRENIFVCQTSHSGVPLSAFSLDQDNNRRADVIEWMLFN